MTFWKRLRTYLVGVGLGLVLVFIFFGDRDLTSWTPSGRILITIDSSEQMISPMAICQLECLDIDKSKLPEILDLADINYSESNTRKEPCPIYFLESKSEYSDTQLNLVWEVCEFEEKVKLISITDPNESCEC